MIPDAILDNESELVLDLEGKFSSGGGSCNKNNGKSNGEGHVSSDAQRVVTNKEAGKLRRSN